MANIYTPIDPKARSFAGGRIGGGVNTVGEAIPIDLGSRGRAYVLPKADMGDYLSVRYGWILSADFDFKAKPNYQSFTSEDLAEFSQVTGRVPLTDVISRNGKQIRLLPAVVAFKDDDDPSTLFTVDATDLSEALGQGVVMQDIYLEMTAEAPTAGRIKTYLPWLNKASDVKFPRLSLRLPDGKIRPRGSIPLMYRISKRDFYAE